MKAQSGTWISATPRAIRQRGSSTRPGGHRAFGCQAQRRTWPSKRTSTSRAWFCWTSSWNKPGIYPLSIFSYGLVRTDGKGPNGLGVRQWMDYLLAKCGPTRAANLGYVPLGGEVLAKARQNVLLIK
jgi:hypothetical protein